MSAAEKKNHMTIVPLNQVTVNTKLQTLNSHKKRQAFQRLWTIKVLLVQLLTV